MEGPILGLWACPMDPTDPFKGLDPHLSRADPFFVLVLTQVDLGCDASAIIEAKTSSLTTSLFMGALQAQTGPHGKIARESVSQN